MVTVDGELEITTLKPSNDALEGVSKPPLSGD